MNIYATEKAMREAVYHLICSSVDDLKSSLLYEDNPTVIKRAMKLATKRGQMTMAKMLQSRLRRMNGFPTA